MLHGPDVATASVVFASVGLRVREMNETDRCIETAGPKSERLHADICCSLLAELACPGRWRWSRTRAPTLQRSAALSR